MGLYGVYVLLYYSKLGINKHNNLIKNFGVYFDHFNFTTISYNMWPSILIIVCTYDKVNKIENFYVEMNR